MNSLSLRHTIYLSESNAVSLPRLLFGPALFSNLLVSKLIFGTLEQAERVDTN